MEWVDVISDNFSSISANWPLKKKGRKGFQQILRCPSESFCYRSVFKFGMCSLFTAPQVVVIKKGHKQWSVLIFPWGSGETASAPHPATSDNFLLLISYFADWRHIHLTCKTALITEAAVCKPHIKQWVTLKSYDLSHTLFFPPLPGLYVPETLIITGTLKGNYSETI